MWNLEPKIRQQNCLCDKGPQTLMFPKATVSVLVKISNSVIDARCSLGLGAEVRALLATGQLSSTLT